MSDESGASTPAAEARAAAEADAVAVAVNIGAEHPPDRTEAGWFDPDFYLRSMKYPTLLGMILCAISTFIGGIGGKTASKKTLT